MPLITKIHDPWRPIPEWIPAGLVRELNELMEMARQIHCTAPNNHLDLGQYENIVECNHKNLTREHSVNC